MAKKTIHIFTTSTGQSVVWPPYEFVKKKDDVEWVNHTAGTVLLLGPDVFDDDQGTATIPKGKDHGAKVKNTAAPGSYSYKVYSVANSAFAIGNSDPELIID